MKNLKNSLLFIGIAAISLTACNRSEEKTADEPHLLQDTIKVSVAETYVKNYAPYAGTAVAVYSVDGKLDTVETPNTRAIWFSLEQLKAFVEKLDKDKGDGIRFYFARYNKSYFYGAPHAPDKKYWGHNTLVMVATKRDSIGKKIIHQDFYAATGGFTPRGFIVGNPPENRGEMCPPPVKCDSTGAGLIEPETIR